MLLYYMTGHSADRQCYRIAGLLHAPSYLLWLMQNSWLLRARRFSRE